MCQGGEANARNLQISRLRKLDWRVHGVYANPNRWGQTPIDMTSFIIG